jgi:hypothetical protein
MKEHLGLYRNVFEDPQREGSLPTPQMEKSHLVPLFPYIPQPTSVSQIPSCLHFLRPFLLRAVEGMNSNMTYLIHVRTFVNVNATVYPHPAQP